MFVQAHADVLFKTLFLTVCPTKIQSFLNFSIPASFASKFLQFIFTLYILQWEVRRNKPPSCTLGFCSKTHVLETSYIPNASQYHNIEVGPLEKYLLHKGLFPIKVSVALHVLPEDASCLFSFIRENEMGRRHFIFLLWRRRHFQIMRTVSWDNRCKLLDLGFLRT